MIYFFIFNSNYRATKTIVLKMGTISTDTKLGIITYVDDEYNYVWSAGFGGLELRYKLNPAVRFECGEMVRFVQSHAPKSIQIVHNLMKDKDTLQIEKDNKIQWKLKVHMTFAPADELDKFKKKDEDRRLVAIAHTESFNYVASYVKGINYKPGVVYEAYISRVPRGHERLAENVGTIFMVIGGIKGFTEVTDAQAIEKVMETCPWREKVMPRENNETGLSEVPPNNNNDRINQNGNFPNNDYHQNYYSNQQEEMGNDDGHSSKKVSEMKWWEECREEPLTDDYAQQLHDQVEGDEYEGLIVGSENNYSVIWSPKFCLVRLQLEKPQNAANPIWPLASWVKFRCFEECSLLAGQKTCRYTAYDVKKSSQPLDIEYVRTFNHGNQKHNCGKGVVAKMKLREPKIHASTMFFAMDNFFGRVLCPIKIHSLFDDGHSVEALAVFLYEYQLSKWVVFSILSENDSWTKIEGLPPKIDAEVQSFFNISTQHDSTYEDTIALYSPTNKYKPPTDWRGVIQEGNKLVDVLGVVVILEGETSVIATSFGLARQPIKWELGTWACATLIPDEDETGMTYSNFMRNLPSYIIEKSRKIPPVVSTRAIVNKNGIEVVLICCGVEMDNGIVKNDYLGTVYDTNKVLNWDQLAANGQPISSFLVEISLSREDSNKNKRFWKILKGHGENKNRVKTVALKLSYWPNSMGRTCDEPHNILCDAEFDLQKYEKEKIKQKGMPNNEYEQLSQKPSTSKQTMMMRFSSVGQSNKTTNAQPTFNGNETTTHVLQALTNSVQTNELGGSSQVPTIAGIRGDSQADLHSQLNMYEPDKDAKKQKRALGIVVTKNEKFAILYTRDFGDCILLPQYCADQLEFDTLFQLGYVIGVKFAPVMEQMKIKLFYSHMCLPEFKQNRRAIKSRFFLDRFVQIYIRCEFTKKNIKQCIEDLNPGENEIRYYVDTDVGKVLLNQNVLDKNELFGKVVKLWITHIQKKYGCHWQIALGDVEALKKLGVNADNPNIYEIEILAGRENGHPTRFFDHYYAKDSSTIPKNLTSFPSDPCPLVNISDDASSAFSVPIVGAREMVLNSYIIKHNVKRLATNGYADFVFGSHVPDIMDGGRYRVKRYISAENNAENSDPEEAEQRGIEEMFHSSSSDEADNSNESVESFHTDNNFSEDVNEFGNNVHQMRIMGNLTPPPSSRHQNQIQSMQGVGLSVVNGVPQQKKKENVIVDDLVSI